MTWWEDYDQALGLAGALKGDEEPSLLAGSAALMLHAAGRRALDSEAAAIRSTRAGLPERLRAITQDPIAGCVSKSLSDAAGKPMYGPFRAAALKAAADEGAVALVDALVASNVPYRDAVAASARSYGIAKRDALILSRIIKSDPSNLSSVAASRNAMLLWARAVTNAESLMVLNKEADEFWVEHKGGRRKRTVNRDAKGRFAPKGAAPAAPTPQQLHDQRMQQRLQRMREGRKQGSSLPMAIGIEQEQAQAAPVQEQRRKQRPPEQRQKAAQSAEQERQARIEQQEREELEELEELRELRAIRRARKQRGEQARQRHRQEAQESGFEMLREAVRRDVDVVVNRSRLKNLFAEMEQRREQMSQEEKRQHLREAARITAENAVASVLDIVDGEVGERFDATEPGKTSFITEYEVINRYGNPQSFTFHIPLMFRPNDRMSAAHFDYPDENDVFRMYTGMDLPTDDYGNEKHIEDLQPGDPGWQELVYTVSLVNKLHAGEMQDRNQHPLEVVSDEFDAATANRNNIFVNAVLEQVVGSDDQNDWYEDNDGNGDSYRVFSKYGEEAVVNNKATLQDYLNSYQPIRSEDNEVFIYKPGHVEPLDSEMAEASMVAQMEQISPMIADTSMRALAIYQLTRGSGGYKDYQYEFPSALMSFDTNVHKTKADIVKKLQGLEREDDNKYMQFDRPDEAFVADVEGVLEANEIDPAEVKGTISARPAVRKSFYSDASTDLAEAFLDQRSNYTKWATMEGQGWNRDYGKEGVRPLWPVGMKNKISSSLAEINQTATMFQRAGMKVPDSLRYADSLISDIDADMRNGMMGETDPKRVHANLDLMRVYAAQTGVEAMKE